MASGPCELCVNPGGEVIWRDDRARIVWIHDDQHPAFMRVIWNRHVKEMTDLPAAERAYFVELVLRLEQILRQVLHPQKINLASLGNMVPHLHWHVIPRFADDPHFPGPVWGEAVRSSVHRIEDPEAFRLSLNQELNKK